MFEKVGSVLRSKEDSDMGARDAEDAWALLAQAKATIAVLSFENDEFRLTNRKLQEQLAALETKAGAGGEGTGASAEGGGGSSVIMRLLFGEFEVIFSGEDPVGLRRYTHDPLQVQTT